MTIVTMMLTTRYLFVCRHCQSKAPRGIREVEVLGIAVGVLGIAVGVLGIARVLEMEVRVFGIFAC